MRQKYLIGILIAFTVLALNIVLIRPADAADPQHEGSQQASPPNRARLDVTINDRGDISVGGVALSALGLAQVDPQVTNLLKTMGDVNLAVQNDAITVDTGDTEVARLLWDADSRARLVGLAQSYGVQLQPGVLERAEQWISSSDIDVSVRSSPEASRPVELTLTKPILVDIAANGQLAVENGPLAAGIDTNVLNTISMGGNRAVACWDKGTLSTSVNGGALPTLVVNPAGVDLITKALNLPINSNGTAAILNATVGVDLSLPGGAHATSANCAAPAS